ncbi:hypothetical protein BKA82DRAFT_4015525 [Pisolithus tinctorius]|nr:hypothetical protein BKA82DRAFT_4015525 [Pisolithus tinctorius]
MVVSVVLRMDTCVLGVLEGRGGGGGGGKERISSYWAVNVMTWGTKSHDSTSHELLSHDLGHSFWKGACHVTLPVLDWGHFGSHDCYGIDCPVTGKNANYQSVAYPTLAVLPTTTTSTNLMGLQRGLTEVPADSKAIMGHPIGIQRGEWDVPW